VSIVGNLGVLSEHQSGDDDHREDDKTCRVELLENIEGRIGQHLFFILLSKIQIVRSYSLAQSKDTQKQTANDACP
jgi:hypothetical protein